GHRPHGIYYENMPTGRTAPTPPTLGQSIQSVTHWPHFCTMLLTQDSAFASSTSSISLRRSSTSEVWADLPVGGGGVGPSSRGSGRRTCSYSWLTFAPKSVPLPSLLPAGEGLKESARVLVGLQEHPHVGFRAAGGFGHGHALEGGLPGHVEDDRVPVRRDRKS